MSLIYVLLFIEVILFGIAWIMTNSDLTSVSVVTITVMIITTLFNIYAVNLWDDPTFYSETIIAVTIGLLAVIFADGLNIVLHKRKVETLPKQPISEISVSNNKILFVSIACLAFTLLYFLNIRSIAASKGLSVISAISAIKTNYQNEEMQLNVFVRQGYKFVNAFAYVGLFLYINNSIAIKKFISRNAIHLVPIICFCVMCVLSGGRVDILRILSAAFFLYMIIIKQSTRWNYTEQKKANYRALKTIVPIVVISAFLMTQLRTITKGNVTTNGFANIIDYVAYYLGGTLQVLNIKIHKGIANYRLDYFGEITFRGIWNFLSRYGLTKEYIPTNIGAYEYLMIHEGIGGNTDTFIGPPLIDFGFIGLFVCIFIEYYIMAKIYYKKIFFSSSNYKRNKTLVLYSFAFFIVTMSYYENCMYIIISFTGIMTLLFLLLAYWFYFNDAEEKCLDKKENGDLV